jgi:tetratricopeptide (TPR) repeat protein
MDFIFKKRCLIFGFTLVLSVLLISCSRNNSLTQGEGVVEVSSTPPGVELKSTGKPAPAAAGDMAATSIATPTPQPETMTVAEAMLSGLVGWRLTPSTSDPAHTMILMLQRTGPAPLILNIPLGSLLVNQDPSQTSYVVRGLLSVSQDEPAQSMFLDDQSWHEIPLEVYSINYSSDAPGTASEFTLVDPVSSEVQRVLESAAGLADGDPDTLQIAIWAITDGISKAQAQQLIAYQSEILSQIFTNAGIDLSRKRIFDPQDFTDPNAYLTRGDQYFQQGEFAQAIGDYNDAIRILESANPPAPGQDLLLLLKYRRGMAYLQKQDQAAAIQDFQSIIDAAPSNALGYYGLGLAYSSGAAPDYPKALSALDQCLSLDTRFTDAYFSRGLVYTALGVSNKAYYDQAIGDFTRAIDLDPNFVEAYLARAQANGARGYENHALKDFKKVLELDEQMVEVYRERGRLYLALGDNPRAISEFVKYLTRKPDAPDRTELQELINSLEGVLPTPSAGQVVYLEDAVRQKWVELQVEALGVTSGDSVRLRLTNLIDQPLNLIIPTGALLLSPSPEQTDMVVRKLRGLAVSESELQPAEEILLEPGASQDYFAEAYSLDFYKADPQAGSFYSLAGMAEPEIVRLLESAGYIPGATANVLAIQAAIWSVVSNIQAGDLTGINMNVDLEIVRALLESAGVDIQCTALFGSGNCPVIPESP